MEATNSWKLSDIVSVQPLNSSGKIINTGCVKIRTGICNNHLAPKLRIVISSIYIQGPSGSSEQSVGNGSASGGSLEFQLVYRKGKKNDNMRFSSEWRSTILTEIHTLLQTYTSNDSGDVIQATKVRKALYLNWPDILREVI